MSKPTLDKAEVALEYPDKFHAGTWEEYFRCLGAAWDAVALAWQHIDASSDVAHCRGGARFDRCGMPGTSPGADVRPIRQTDYPCRAAIFEQVDKPIRL